MRFGPIELVILQSVSACNLNCSYCYLSEEERKKREFFPLDQVYDLFLNLLTSRYAMQSETIQVAWHAGEPLLASRDYYRDFITHVNSALKTSNRSNLKIEYAIQSNGLKIDQDWCDFLRTHDIAIGLSCDGPDFLHNLYRKKWNTTDSHDDVLKAMALLNKNDIHFDTLATITEEALDYPDEFFDFFLNNGCVSVGLNFIEKIGAYKQDFSGQHLARCTRFIRRLFDRYIEHRLENPNNYLLIREFDDFIVELLNKNFKYSHENELIPFRILNIDRYGNFTTYSPELLTSKNNCYENNDFILGNLFSQSLEEIAESEKFKLMYRDINQGLALCESTCDYFGTCGGKFPAAKHGENQTFVSTETHECMIREQIIPKIIIENLSNRLESLSAVPA